MKRQSLNKGLVPIHWDYTLETLETLRVKGLEEKKNREDAIAFIAEKIVKVLESNGFYLGYFYNCFFVFSESHWKVVKDDAFDIYLHKSVSIMYPKTYRYRTDRFLKELRVAIIWIVKKLPDCNNSVTLNCSNGTIDFENGKVKLRGYRKSDYLTYQLPYSYNPNAVSPLWNKFLDEMLPDKEQQMLLHQFIGYSFTKHLKLEKAMFLYGKGCNGKSVVLEVITALLGKENTANVSIGMLTKDPNTIMLIENKLLNCCSENEKHINTNQFKILVSGEPVIGKKLYQNKRSVENYAKLMFNLNALPNIKENKASYARRLIILPFNKKPVMIDPELHHKIISSELDGVLNRVLEGLKNLLKDGRFIDNSSVDDLIKKYIGETDTFSRFINENRNILKSFGWDKVANFHQCYVYFCNKHNSEHISLSEFGKNLSKIGYPKQKRNDGVYYQIS